MSFPKPISDLVLRYVADAQMLDELTTTYLPDGRNDLNVCVSHFQRGTIMAEMFGLIALRGACAAFMYDILREEQAHPAFYGRWRHAVRQWVLLAEQRYRLWGLEPDHKYITEQLCRRNMAYGCRTFLYDILFDFKVVRIPTLFEVTDTVDHETLPRLLRETPQEIKDAGRVRTNRWRKQLLPN